MNVKDGLLDGDGEREGIGHWAWFARLNWDAYGALRPADSEVWRRVWGYFRAGSF